MARDISASLAAEYRFPRLAHLHLLIRLRPARIRARRALARLFSRRHPDRGIPGRITPAFDQARERYRANRWVYIENMWDEAFHRYLTAQWPQFFHFNPIKEIGKSYDVGIRWSAGAERDPAFLDHHPALREAFDYIRSTEFAGRVTALAGDGIPRACMSILLTRAYTGSSVIAHRDSSIEHHFLNIVFFINGTGGTRSGGLAIMNDNELKDVVFEPTNLTNSCIVYDMSAPFFHGFRPMRFGTYRWTINAQFCGAEHLNNLRKIKKAIPRSYPPNEFQSA